MRFLLWLVLLLSAFGALARSGSAQGTPRATRMVEADTSQGILRPGDMVEIQVWRREDLSGEFPIAPDSTIVHPLYRNLKIGGLTPEQAYGTLHVYLTQLEQNPEFIMRPLLKVSVAGEVNSPDVYELPPGTEIARALTLAGGVTAVGRLDRVRLTRAGRRLIVDLWGPNGTPQMTIRSGDEIFVERRRSARDVLATVSYALNTLTFFFGVYQTFVANR